MITPSFSLTATERALPRLALDFTTAILDPRVTFTRSGNTATVINSSGYVVGINADLPRFDHDPITLVCKGLLIEEARTNNFVYSSDFSQANWTKQLSTVSLDNAVNSPANVAGVYKLIPDNGSAGHLRYSFTTANSTTYAVSFFCKKAEYDWVAFGRGGPTVWFDLTNGVLGTVGAGYTGSIQAFPNGWYRCTLTYVETTGASGTWRFYPSSSNGTIATGNGTNGVYIWGSDLQVGTFQTSHIPTEATTVTRNPDLAIMTGTNFSDWYNATEGTFVIRSATKGLGLGGSSCSVIVADGTSNNITAVAQYLATNSRRGIVVTGGVLQVALLQTVPIDGAFRRYAFAYKQDNFAGAMDGSAVSTDVSGTVPTVDRLSFGNLQAAGAPNESNLNGFISYFAYYPQRLINNEVTAFSK
jgi:hypothetical protein